MDRSEIRARLLLWLRTFWQNVAGDLQWSPPAWLRWLRAVATRFSAVVEANPRRSAGYLASGLAVTAAAVLGWRWYESLPKPVEYSVAVTAPERTCIECDPPGKPNATVISFSGSVAPLDQAGKVLDPAKSGVS